MHLREMLHATAVRVGHCSPGGLSSKGSANEGWRRAAGTTQSPFSLSALRTSLLAASSPAFPRIEAGLEYTGVCNHLPRNVSPC